ncbi:cell division cycle protein 48 [Nitzschia inconspicua]|uniref:Cell division cycle protein 48 n=1 Tax=Nitzschia inconspicua TaxID=303405 RepID=A0A9K3PYC2_9STRA|nr:cell division cycle protein 48 [Nitzschia inconspicua]
MSGNNNPLLPIDYASQNEEWMLIYDRLEEQLAALHERDITGNDNDAEETTTETCEEIANLESMLLAARIGRLTNITCAMMDSNASQGKNNTNRNALKQYLIKTQQEFDTLPEQPLIKLLTMKSNKDQSNDNDNINMMESTNPLEEEDLTTELQVDAFFEEYPECMRSDYGIGGCNDSDTDNDDNDDDVSCDSSSDRTKASSQGKPPTKSQRLEKKPKSMPTSQQNESANASIPPARPNLPSPLPKQPTAIIDLVDENVTIWPVSEQNDSLQSSLQNSFEQPISRPPTRDGTENNRPNTFNYTPASQDTMATAIGLESTKTVDQQPSQTQWKPQPNTNNNLPPSTGLSTNWGQTHQGTTTAPTKATANPYATKRPQALTYSQIPPPCSVPPSASSIHNQTAWANHCHQQNPFQTAREMADAEHNSFRNTNHPQEPMTSQHHALPGNTQPRSSMRQWGQQPTPPQPPTDYGFSYQGHGEQPEDSVANSGPHIPESLKRKFQPPKRLANNNTNSNSNNNNNNTSSNNNHGPAGGGRPYGPGKGGNVQPRSQTNRPSIRPSGSNGPPNGSNGGGAVSDTTKNDHNTINDDEEELPEELQHLDKELVLKIQNEIMESGETVNFDDIAGLKDAKQTVLEVVVWPMQRPDVFTGLRRAPNGLLLFGPPGTGKTLIGKAIANETKATFFSISSSSLTSKWIGEGEKLVKTLFAVAAYREPAVVFIDEIDSLLTQRKSTENEASRRIKTEFLVQLDGAGTSKQGRVLVIGATNRPQELDEAARRRFTKRMYIPLPVEGDRRVLIQVMLKNNNHKLTEAQIEILAKETEGFSGADLKALCTDAAMGPIRQLGAKAMEVDVKDIPPISFKHFKRSLKGTRPSVAPDDITQYIEWDRVYGSSRSAEEEFDDEDDEEDEDDE